MSRLGMIVVAGAAVFALLTYFMGRKVSGMLDPVTDEATLKAAAAAIAAKDAGTADAGPAAQDAGSR